MEQFNAHPKTQLQAMEDDRFILLTADHALHAKSESEKQSCFGKIASELDSMTPSERGLMTINFLPQQRSAEHDHILSRVKGLSSVPETRIEFDANHDLKSISFRSVSDDEAFGKSVKVDLTNQRKDEEAGAQAYKRADGSVVVAKSDSGGLKEADLPDGTQIRRNSDRSYTLTDGWSPQTITNVSIGGDGSVSYAQSAQGISAQIKESIAPNGDKVSSFDATINGSHHKLTQTEHDEHPPNAQSVTTVTTDKDGQKSTYTSTVDWNGVEVTKTDRSIITHNLNDVSIEPLVNGKTGGKLLYEPSFDDHGNITGGKLQVTFPDGFKKSYSADREEMERVSTSKTLAVDWQPKKNDPHHFHIQF